MQEQLWEISILKVKDWLSPNVFEKYAAKMVAAEKRGQEATPTDEAVTSENTTPSTISGQVKEVENTGAKATEMNVQIQSEQSISSDPDFTVDEKGEEQQIEEISAQAD